MGLRRRLTVGRARRALVAAVMVAAAIAGVQPTHARVQAADADGHVFVLEAPAGRIVSLAPHLTELLFAAGAGDRVVGTVAYSDHPAAARAIARVGDAALLDLERIAALRPDLIVVWRNGTSPQQLQRLATLNVPMFASEARTLSDIGASLRALGALAGAPEAAARKAAEFDAEVTALRARYATRTTLKVFYQIWPQPLMTINGEHLISQVLALCGARNVFADQRLLTPTVTEEAVLLADPDAIVVGRVDGSDAGAFERWRRLGALRAARAGHFVLIDRVVQGARELCQKLDALR
jgi:iron complex transport system substrate-binding protein